MKRSTIMTSRDQQALIQDVETGSQVSSSSSSSSPPPLPPVRNIDPAALLLFFIR